MAGRGGADDNGPDHLGRTRLSDAYRPGNHIDRSPCGRKSHFIRLVSGHPPAWTEISACVALLRPSANGRAIVYHWRAGQSLCTADLRAGHHSLCITAIVSFARAACLRACVHDGFVTLSLPGPVV
ncbi:hypothetical protein D3C87_1485830 [compost metagenome]